MLTTNSCRRGLYDAFRHVVRLQDSCWVCLLSVGARAGSSCPSFSPGVASRGSGSKVERPQLSEDVRPRDRPLGWLMMAGGKHQEVRWVCGTQVDGWGGSSCPP